MPRPRSDQSVLRLRDFRLLLAGQSISIFGDRIVSVALAFAVIELGGSASEVGLVLAAAGIALVSSVLIGGVVADRLPRRRVMITADVVRVASPVAAESSASDHTSATPAISIAAITPCVATRARSAAIITSRRESRSATTPPISTVRTIGNARAARTSPTSDADPPTSSTANASATATMRSPKIELA